MKTFFLPKSIVATRRQDKDMYHDFLNYFVAPVVGKRKYEKNSIKFLLSRYVTVSDEAFALLVFENNYERWLDMGNKNNWTTSDVTPLYSTGGNGTQTPKNAEATQGLQDNTSSTSMFQGWSIQGIRRFNALYDLIYKERMTEEGILFEEEFLQDIQEKKDQTKKSKTAHTFEYEMCRHDLWVMEDDINETSTTDAVLESGHYKNYMNLLQNRCVENSDNEVDDDNDDDNENGDEGENDDESTSSASSDGFKKMVSV